MPTTDRIELSDGDWADIRERMTLPMQSAFNKAAKAGKSAIEGEPIEPDSPIAEAARELIVAAVKSWSYGPVSMTVLINDVPVEDQERLEAAAVEGVQQSPLWQRALAYAGAVSPNGSSTPSSTAPSRRSLSSRTSAQRRGGSRTS